MNGKRPNDKRLNGKRLNGVGASAIARQVNLSRQRVSVLLKRGLSPAEIVQRAKNKSKVPGSGVRIPTGRMSGTRIKRRTDTDNGTTGPATVDSTSGPISITAQLNEALRRKEIAAANRNELDLRVSSGELIDRSHTVAMLQTAIIGCRDVILRIPDASDSLSYETDAAEIERRLLIEVERGLALIKAALRELELNG